MLPLKRRDLTVGRHQLVNAVECLLTPLYFPQDSVSNKLIEVFLGRFH
jgi:hypothetical protein